jgi:hypothetical protein
LRYGVPNPSERERTPGVPTVPTNALAPLTMQERLVRQRSSDFGLRPRLR